LHRHQDLEDLVLHAHRLDAVLEVGLHLVLIPGVGMDHVPLLGGPLCGIRIVRLWRLAGEAGGLPGLVPCLALGDLLLVCHGVAGRSCPTRSCSTVSSTAM